MKDVKDLKSKRETPVKSCPWCGETPDTNELGWGGTSIRCNNESCKVRPETGWCDSATEALTMWNTRST